MVRPSWRSWSFQSLSPNVQKAGAGVAQLASLALFGAFVSSCASEPCVDDGFFQSSNEDCAKLLRSSCVDKLRNGDESDVDCGGSCKGCQVGQHCEKNADCESDSCVNNACVETKQSTAGSCQDGVKNGEEADVDCGGVCPTACEDGKSCEKDADCESGGCDPQSKTCLARSCSDKAKNNQETDVDCGGRTCPGCEVGRNCGVHFDCKSLSCNASQCQGSSCSDGLPNANETDIDCGGGDCNACPNRASCKLDRDCLSEHCVQERCVAASCNDQKKSPGETDVDCGGPDCAPCPASKSCEQANDCVSQKCENKSCVASSCEDNIKNGAESDLDCGRACPKQCELGQECVTNTDCKTGACDQGQCVDATCGDGKKNGTESDQDCGGNCGATCESGQSCAKDKDCRSGACLSNGSCAPSKCDDGRKNGFETGLDCGGLLCPGCPDGASCIANRDCLSNLCLGGSCVRPEGCENEKKDGDETDVDCGGSCGATCQLGQSCQGNQDCVSQTCNQGVCQGIIYRDQDLDGFGDPSTGKASATIPDGWVTKTGDCDDQDKKTYPGAASVDSSTACMTDSDGDGRGDIDPKAGVTKGTDCYDAKPEFWACLEATVPAACRNASANDSDALSVTASLGTGSYTYQWSPSTFLTGADTASPTVTGLDRPTEYTVTVGDGVRNVERSIMVLPSAPLKLNAGDCQYYQKLLQNGRTMPDLAYTNQGTKVCELGNGELALHMCGIAKYANAQLKGELLVETRAQNDDDYVGFVWGAQDASNFYVIVWKKASQTIQGLECEGGDTTVPQGIMVKKIHDSTKAGDPKGFAAMTGRDLFCEHDTDRSKLLLGPSDTMNQTLDVGWDLDTTYSVTIKHTPGGSQVKVTKPGANPGQEEEVSSFTVVDTAAPFVKGGFGSLSFSQPGACAQNFQASCLP